MPISQISTTSNHPTRKTFCVCNGNGEVLVRIDALEIAIDDEIVKLADVDQNGNWTIIFAAHLGNIHIFTESTQAQKEGK
jgi:hypothetical protein